MYSFLTGKPVLQLLPCLRMLVCSPRGACYQVRGRCSGFRRYELFEVVSVCYLPSQSAIFRLENSQVQGIMDVLGSVLYQPEASFILCMSLGLSKNGDLRLTGF